MDNLLLSLVLVSEFALITGSYLFIRYIRKFNQELQNSLNIQSKLVEKLEDCIQNQHVKTFRCVHDSPEYDAHQGFKNNL